MASPKQRQWIPIIRDTEPEIVETPAPNTIHRDIKPLIAVMLAIVSIIVLAVCGGCTQRGFNRTTLITATAALACDYAGTRNGLAEGIGEMNPILGSHPSQQRLLGYNLLAIAATIAGYEVTGKLFGERWQWGVPLVVTFVELPVVSHNAIVVESRPVCGVL